MKKTIINIFKTIGILSLCCWYISCADFDVNDTSPLIGEYEYFYEDGSTYEISIMEINSALSWYSIGTDRQPIRITSSLKFEVPPFLKWDYYNTIQAKLEGDTLFVMHEVFELKDLKSPIISSHRAYIKKQ